ncbi:MAG TPA: hypothetical protein VJ650_00560 [Gemmatimonadaceae bacterium]|nr:hypothetical protein [Gemmatimonadaceae bacterium]
MPSAPLTRIIEFDKVRIVALHGPPEAHVSLAQSTQLPAIGDEGTVVELISENGHLNADPDAHGTRYMVENVGPDGGTQWLAEFARNELELVSRPG